MIKIDDENPWKTHSDKTVYENPWIKVVENQVTNPNGGRGIYGVVHFQHIAIGVIPVDEEDHTWLVGQYRYAQNRFEWEIPEGGGKPDVDPVESARRELREETGILAKDFELILTDFQTSNSVCNEVGQIFIARDLTHHAPEPEETEQLFVKRLPLTDAFEMVHRGEIRDSMSVAGLLKLEVRMLRG
tara:strand:- start:2397 stop:2957 length:561 start_codon:yes stop_codon:yes gene_type:complete